MRSQRAKRFRDGLDTTGVAAYERGEPSQRTALEQRTARIAAGGEPPPANTVRPAISGTQQVGQTLTCTPGTWTDEGTGSAAYQWYRGNTPIAGATANTRLLAAADEDAELFCRVTWTDDWGSAMADSLFTGRIAAA